MILAMNIGNTNFSIGHIKNGRIHTARFPTASLKTQMDFADSIRQSLAGTAKGVEGVILASVNPAVTHHLENAVKQLLGVAPLTANASMSMSLDLSCYDTKTLGIDRIVVCEAAVSKYEGALIVCDLGTATTINVVDGNKRFLGGSILSGLTMGVNALASNTASLPQIELNSCPPLVGRSTQECIASGAIFGHAALLDGMTARIEEALGQKATVIVTGGNAGYILPACQDRVMYAPDLLLEGLFGLYSIL
jgi:type III pantothenate kinase